MQFVNWAGDKVLRFVAKRTLKRFLKSLDPEQFNDFSLHKGVQLSHLEFETEVINEQILADAPVKVSYGRIGTLNIEWSIQNMTLKFTFSDVDLILDYVPPKQNSRPTPQHEQSTGGNVHEDVLARSLIIGNLSKADLTSLEEQPECKSDVEVEYPAVPDTDDTQSGMIKDLIDKAVQRMRVTVLNGIISIRFPSQVQHDTLNIVRIEVPWLELRDKETSESTPAGSTKFYRKVLTFQSFIVYLHSAKADADLLSSTLISPRLQRSRTTDDSTNPDGSKKSDDPTADVVCICYSDSQNTIDLTVPADSTSGIGIKLAVFLQTIHCIATPSQLSTLRSVFELLSVSDGQPPNTQQDEGTNVFSVTVHIMHLLCAILPQDSGPPPVDVWDVLLDQMASDPEQARATAAASSEKQIMSPCKEILSEHLLLEIKQLGRSSAVVVRVSSQKEASQDYVSRVEVAFSHVDVRWITEPDPTIEKNIPSILQRDVSICDNGMYSLKLADFEPITGRDGEQRPRITIIATTTRDDNGNVIQQIRTRMCPRLLIYSGLLKKFIESFGGLLTVDDSVDSVGRTLSTDSFRSCEQSSADPSRGQRRTYSPRSGSPLSSTSNSDFEDAFHKDNYRRFSANPAGSPPPYKRQSDTTTTERCQDMTTNTVHKDPQNLARSVTFGCSTIHTSQSAASTATLTPKVPPVPGFASSTLVIQREVLLYGKVQITAYYNPRNKDEMGIIGPYLQSILDYHTEDGWLSCGLQLRADDLDIRSTSSVKICTGVGVIPPGEQENNNVVWRMSCSVLKLQLMKENTESVIAMFESKHMRSTDTNASVTGSVRQRPSNITITLKQDSNPDLAGSQTRNCSHISEAEEATLRDAAERHSDLLIQVQFPSGNVYLQKDEVLLTQYLISDLLDSLSPPANATNASASLHDDAYIAGVPLGLLHPTAELKSWQRPSFVVCCNLECPRVMFNISAPLCFPSDEPPPYSVPYPKKPPCFRYLLSGKDLSLSLVVHVASDPFIRLGVSVESADLWEYTDVDVFGTEFTNNKKSRKIPILHNYHNLYQRSNRGKKSHPSRSSETQSSGLRIIMGYSQCSPGNPVFVSVRDRQDIKLTLILNRMLLTHRVSQDSNSWLLVLTELFTDVQRVDGLATRNESNNDVSAGRLRATCIDVVAYNLIVDYTPKGLPARLLVIAEQITFACLVVMLSEEFRATIGVKGASILLDNGHFKEDLVTYDKEASGGNKSLFGKSMGGVVSDLELLGFITVLHSTEQCADDELTIVIKTIAPTSDCVPHLRGRGHTDPDPDMDPLAEHLPFAVEVTSGRVATDCCRDSFKLFQDSIVYYLSGSEQSALRTINSYYQECLHLPEEEKPPQTPPSTDLTASKLKAAHTKAANAIKTAIQQAEGRLAEEEILERQFGDQKEEPVVDKGETASAQTHRMIVHEGHCDTVDQNTEVTVFVQEDDDLASVLNSDAALPLHQVDESCSVTLHSHHNDSAVTFGDQHEDSLQPAAASESEELLQFDGASSDTSSLPHDIHLTDSIFENDLQRGSASDDKSSLLRGLPLSEFLEDDYFTPGDDQVSRLRNTERPPGGPIPQFRLIINGLCWTCNLYGGKDFVTALSADAVHRKLQSLKTNVKVKQAHHLYRSTRVFGQLVSIAVDDMFVLLDLHAMLGAPETGDMWELKAGCKTLEVVDKLTVSARNKILTSIHSVADRSDLVMVELQAGVPKAMIGLASAPKHAELTLSLNIDPLRINVDQDSLEFLSRFFGTTTTPPPSAPAAAPASFSTGVSNKTSTVQHNVTNQVHFIVENPEAAADDGVYFRKVTIGRITLKVDYNSKRCSLQNLLKVEPLELLNLVNIEGMVIELDPVTVMGCWSQNLALKMAEQWWDTLRISELLSGVPTVRSVTRIGSGAARVISTPYNDYKSGKNPFSGLPNALVGFVREFAVEAMHLTEQAAIVGGGIISAGVQVLDVQQTDDDGPASPAVAQPATVFDGLKQGIETMQGDLNAGVRVLSSLPQVVRDGYLVLLARSLCTVTLMPLRGLFRGWCVVAQGSMTALDPQRRAEHSMLYKIPREHNAAGISLPSETTEQTQHECQCDTSVDACPIHKKQQEEV
eukprot:TRINITY_DN64_c6_g1_i1.p1 TRINITY_DN64_c6_g1~~TRINITY_DN64_c6_g1_i1.p1  ORF type:complete len:2106 (+),score=388.33 TRINITY_DN64_c6_g1_i1:88-6405(+)